MSEVAFDLLSAATVILVMVGVLSPLWLILAVPWLILSLLVPILGEVSALD